MSDPVGPTGCPPRAEWLALVDDVVTEPRRGLLLEHLRSCPACATTMATLAGQWSLAGVATGLAAGHGPATDALGARVAAAPPDEKAPARIVPAALPTIPGFRDLAAMARGGMGVVYRATDEALERTVAVKLLPGWHEVTPAALARARREALALARIDDPGVVRVFSAGDVDGVPWIAMEWIDGPTLSQRLADGPLPPRAAARIARALARALARVHAEGIVHRDIKPDNVLLARAVAADDEPVPKLVDFGLARPDDVGGATTQATGAVGTPSFMAPEQTGLDPALGAVGPATDIHGVGATLYCMLTGRAPYQAASTTAALARAAAADAPALALLAPGVPADLQTIVAACLRRQPAARYGSAAALAADLSRFLDGLPVQARPVGPVERGLKWIRRRPARAATLAAAVAALLGGAVGTAYHVRRLREANAEISAGRDAALAAAALARQSFERLTDDTAERLLVRGGRLDDLDRDHLRAVRDEYRSWPLEPEVATALRFRIAGLRRVAMIFRRLERGDEMVATIEMALEEIDDLDRRGLLGLDDELLRYELRRGVRADLVRQGRGDEAIAAMAADIVRLEERVRVAPALRPALAATLGDHAAMLDARGEHDAARGLYGRALGLFDELARDAGGARVPAHLEMSTRYNAAISRALNLSADAEACARRLLERARSIVAGSEGEDHAAGVRGLTLGLRVLGKMARDRGALDEALGYAEECAAAVRSVAARSPANHDFADDMVSATRDIWVCHQGLGRSERALPRLEEAVAMATAAVTAEPAAYQRVRSLVAGLRSLAQCRADTGDIHGAIDSLERLVAAVEPWQQTEAVGAEARGLVCATLGDLGQLLDDAKRPTEAIAALERAQALASGDRAEALGAALARLRGRAGNPTVVPAPDRGP